jgi:hypothetical protein
LNKSEDIDFVIPWVDGSDPKWLEQKALYSQNPEILAAAQNNERTRYEDWGLLRYWFRGVEKFAPWVHRVHFITWGHTPEWLNVNHPKLNIVKHEEFIPEEYLPTFSSHPIELNMHRIPGLTEQFVYFNDDTFLLSPTVQEDFFKRGLPRSFACMIPCKVLKNSWFYFPLNNVAVINAHFPMRKSVMRNLPKWFNPQYGVRNFVNLLMLPFPSFYGFYEQHLPSSFLKSTLEKVWEEEFEILDNTSRHKFRNFRDVNQWLFGNWQMAEGNFYPRSLKFGKAFQLFRRNDEYINEMLTYIRKQQGKVICINDGVMTEDVAEAIRNSVKAAFNDILPDESEYEI